MLKDQNYNNLLYQEISKALHDEALLESALPVLYQKADAEISKSIIKKLMDANKRHQDLLDTAALSLASVANPGKQSDSTISGLLSTVKNITIPEQAQWGYYVIPTLQKVIHQQIASFKILASTIKKAGYNHLSEDFYHLVDEANLTCQELQDMWPSCLELTAHSEKPGQ